ncbi:MAG TPA: efflux RND transporter periplasmic adaptor subunit [Chitinophagaceae bacterium]|nr:efflux RND transporter periplasmic adaptor subunit [Chitinophagaceae bacterium]
MKAIKILIAFFVVLASCKNGSKEAAATATPDSSKATTAIDVVQLSDIQVKNAGIVLAKPELREMHSVLRVNGVIDVPPQNIISVSIPLGGYLKKTSLIPGTYVRKGSVLAIVEDQQYIQLQQDYLTTKSRLEYLLTDYNRQKGLNETKSASDKVLQQAKSEYDSHKILARSLAEKLRLVGVDPDKLSEGNISRSVNVYSPINGYVTKVNVNIGKYVNPSDVLFELINPDDLHLNLTVFENDASKITAGQRVSFTTNNNPAEQYSATVHLVTPNISEDRSTDIHCDIDKKGKGLFPGTFVNAQVALAGVKVTSVPEEAVVKWENRNYIFIQTSANSFKMLPVETGTYNGGYVEIRNPLPEGEVVIKNAYTILMKMKNSAEN